MESEGHLQLGASNIGYSAQMTTVRSNMAV